VEKYELNLRFRRKEQKLNKRQKKNDMKQQEEKLEPVKENFMRDAYLEFKTKHPEVSFEQWLLL
jgi:hypothetical protein